MKKKPQNEDSDEFEADEPEEQEDSDYAPEEEAPKKKRGRAGKATPAKKTPPAKKKKVEKKPPSDEEDEEEEEEEEEDEEGDDSEDESDAAGNGSFVVLKEDLKKEGVDPPLWKIDGKALLQKFLPFEQDGKKLHKSTSTYSGWTANNRDQYAAAPVSYVVQGKKETIIEFLRDQVNLDEKVGKDSEKPKAKS